MHSNAKKLVTLPNNVVKQLVVSVALKSTALKTEPAKKRQLLKLRGCSCHCPSRLPSLSEQGS